MQGKDSRHLGLKRTIIILTLFITILLLPIASALEISEIMYDALGNDEGYEWIEIYNNETESVDLCKYKFYEGETNHKLNSSSCALASGEYAVIADVAENLDFSCNVFDSSWQSLSNTGEALCIRDSNQTDLSCITYASEWGAAGDDNSLQLFGSEWKAAAPTPGTENVYVEAEQEQEQVQENQTAEQQEEEEQPDEEGEETIEIANASETKNTSLKQTTAIPSSNKKQVEQPKIVKEDIAEQEPVYAAKTKSSLKISYFIILLVSLALNTSFVVYALKKKSL